MSTVAPTGPPVPANQVAGLLPASANLTSLYLLWGGAMALLVVMIAFAIARFLRSRTVLRPIPSRPESTVVALVAVAPMAEASGEPKGNAIAENEVLDASFFSTADDAEVAAAAAEGGEEVPPSTDVMIQDITRAFRSSSDALTAPKDSVAVKAFSPAVLEDPVVKRVHSVLVPRRVNSNSLQRQVPHPPPSNRNSGSGDHHGHHVEAGNGAHRSDHHHNDHNDHGHQHEATPHRDLSGGKRSTPRNRGSRSSNDHHERDRARDREREREKERERHRRHRQTSREHK